MPGSFQLFVNFILEDKHRIAVFIYVAIVRLFLMLTGFLNKAVGFIY